MHGSDNVINLAKLSAVNGVKLPRGQNCDGFGAFYCIWGFAPPGQHQNKEKRV